MGYVTVGLLAANVVCKKQLHKLDKEVAGAYTIEVQDTVPEDERGAVALDVFHVWRDIKVLDDFEFVAYDPATGKVLDEPEDYEAYSGCEQGNIVSFSDSRKLKVYQVRLSAVSDDKTSMCLGTVDVVAHSKKDAREAAFKLLWDSRVNACRATYQVIPK